MLILKPNHRKLVYALTFEALAIVLSTLLLAVLSQNPSQDSWPVAVAVSVIALIWNYGFNSLFEWFELKLGITARTISIRLLHASSFELGLFMFTIPLYMWWYQVGLFKAISMELTILLFFFVYTYVFTCVFDRFVPRYHET